MKGHCGILLSSPFFIKSIFVWYIFIVRENKGSDFGAFMSYGYQIKLLIEDHANWTLMFQFHSFIASVVRKKAFAPFYQINLVVIS